MKESFATQLLEIADKIEPGLTKIRGQILLELQIAQVNLNFNHTSELYTNKSDLPQSQAPVVN